MSRHKVTASNAAVRDLPPVGNRPAWIVAVIVIGEEEDTYNARREDGPDTLIYADPPYLCETRSSPDVYACEMTEADHRELLEALKGCKGKVLLSGYASALYDRELVGWARHPFDIANHAAGGEEKRRMTEVVWCNFSPTKEG
jgi:DNA adenine methylase